MKQISARQFRTTFASLTEPVSVLRREPDGDIHILGTWTPGDVLPRHRHSWGKFVGPGEGWEVADMLRCMACKAEATTKQIDRFYGAPRRKVAPSDFGEQTLSSGTIPADLKRAIEESRKPVERP